MDQLVNQSLDRYKIIALLGEGGMGAVFKARDLTLQRDVAIKVMHSQFARQPNFQERFLQEARTAARLNHPCIVQVYDFGQTRGLLYIVMKLIAGNNLETMLINLKQQGKWISLAESVQIVRQVAQALDYAHREGILHRDLKPANIMIEPDNTGSFPYRPILTDLGLAKLAEGGVMTQDGTSMGTPAYMSPEQALGQPGSPRSDIYSLGVLLFELAVGQRPFPIKSITEAIRFHTQENPPRPTSIRPDLPKLIEDVILKAMEKDPANRFPSAEAMSKALEGSLPAAADIASAPTAMERAVSLITQYQEAIPEPRGQSVFEGIPAPAPSGQDRIQVVYTDKTSRMVPITKPSLSIGRDQDNDIVINDTKSSRHHARIDFDGTNYKVVDLNSTNGSYLDNARLLPGIAELWTPEKVLRVGEAFLRLIRPASRPVAGTAVYRSDGTQVEPQKVLSSPGEGRVGLFIENASVTLEPGQRTQLNLTVLNQGQVVDHFKVSLEGLPPTWLPASPPPIQLMPGTQQSVTLAIQPPRTSAARAGRYPTTVRVASQDNPNQTAESRLTLTLAPYSQFTTELFPQKVRSGKTARLSIRNLGNIQETFTIDWTDRADELTFTPPHLQLRVAEGQTAAAEFKAKPKQFRLFGGEQSHSFSTRVAASQGEPQTQSGEMISRALIPVWVLAAMFTLCLILFAAGAAIWGGINSRNSQATATAISAETMVANIVAGTSQAKTAAAEKLASANSATQQAATQNAIVKGTADVASTQSAAVVMTATAAAQEAQNSSTATALAVAQQLADAQTATAQAQANASATAAAVSAAQTQTASAIASQMDFFVKTWVNVDPEGGMRRLVIEKVNDTTLSFHGYGDCTPTECDWGAIEVPFTPPNLQGKWTFSFKTTSIAVTKSGERINVATFDNYNEGDSRADRNDSFEFETLDSRNQAMNEFIGTWSNTDASAGMPQLIIQKVDDFTLSFHGFGNCTPTYCDWGVTNVPFNPPNLQGLWTFSFKTTAIAVVRSGHQLNASTYDKYNAGDTRADRATNYTFQR